MMEHESGRCRRTDGKKWRCSKEVLPEQKYCESHIHRGRKRSRKYSEVSLDSISTATSTKHPINVTNTITKLSESLLVNNVKKNANVNDIDRKEDNNVQSLFASGQNFNLDYKNVDEKRKRGENGYGDAKSSECNNVVRNKFNLESMNKGEKSNTNVEALVTGFLPRSNLHVGGMSIKRNKIPLTEETRCRRTDGKKWRCSREVMTNQKYCASHMHRGAKRIITNGSSSESVRSRSTVYFPVAVAKREEDEVEEENGVNTRLCISPAIMNLELMRRSPTHSNGSSSDATTITDENGCVCP
ncbi:growth-regulating factor 9 [Impatiens glandulifera]|uniref:growth-regulating factor 9 n=1 Tax=Impatiens glandulifera TaxID=253017 RepID=UPI001FB0FFC3|nr:growth-regulating factor 9 [Impatiens glandulifera]XP_047315625.1 growth-regulating factor 9 [Impatiens glandulifera]